MEVKSGLKTTEFYIAMFAPLVVGILVGLGFVTEADKEPMLELVKLVITGIVALVSATSYIKARKEVKIEAMKTQESPVELG